MKSGFIGNQKDLKNQEVTAIIRVNKRVGRKTACCIKMRGGRHHKHSPDQAACIQLDVSTRDSGHAGCKMGQRIIVSFVYYLKRKEPSCSVIQSVCL